MSSLRYGALGHPITDIDTGAIIDVGSGSIVESSIIGVSAGSNGIPGEVNRLVFNGKQTVGQHRAKLRIRSVR